MNTLTFDHQAMEDLQETRKKKAKLTRQTKVTGGKKSGEVQLIRSANVNGQGRTCRHSSEHRKWAGSQSWGSRASVTRSPRQLAEGELTIRQLAGSAGPHRRIQAAWHRRLKLAEGRDRKPTGQEEIANI